MLELRLNGFVSVIGEAICRLPAVVTFDPIDTDPFPDCDKLPLDEKVIPDGILSIPELERTIDPPPVVKTELKKFILPLVILIPLVERIPVKVVVSVAVD